MEIDSVRNWTPWVEAASGIGMTTAAAAITPSTAPASLSGALKLDDAGNSHGRWIELMFYGESTAADQVHSAQIRCLNADKSGRYWQATQYGLTLTAGASLGTSDGVNGEPTTTAFLVDTIAVTAGDTNNDIRVTSPAGDGIATVRIHTQGAEYLRLCFSSSNQGTTGRSYNAMWRYHH